MKSETKQETTYTLKLSTDEATWLRRLIQNPIYTTLECEPILDQQMRGLLWNALIPPTGV